jgi:hypothetical protein
MLHLPLRPHARLAQNEELGCTGREARRGRGLGKMTRRKREITGLANEQDFPHLVELAAPPEGFRGAFLEFDAFHRERRIPVRRGRSRHRSRPILYSTLLPRRCHCGCIPHVAGVEDYQVALATYRAACERWPGTPITLRQGPGVCAWSSADAPHLKS